MQPPTARRTYYCCRCHRKGNFLLLLSAPLLEMMMMRQTGTRLLVLVLAKPQQLGTAVRMAQEEEPPRLQWNPRIRLIQQEKLARKTWSRPLRQRALVLEPGQARPGLGRWRGRETRIRPTATLRPRLLVPPLEPRHRREPA